MRADPLAVLVEPAAQPRPFADQGLVGDLGGAVSSVTSRASASRRAARRLAGGGALRDELVDLHAAPGVLAALADLGEAEEHAAEQRAVLVGQRVDDRSAVRRDRRGDAAGLAVALDGERAPVATLPGRAERVRQQRQRAGLARDVTQDQVDQPGLEPQPREPGRLGDGARSSPVFMGPRRIWLPATARASSGAR